MGEPVYLRARREALQLLETAWDGEYPVKLGELSNELGTEVFEVPLGSKLAGFVSKGAGEPARIMLNADQNYRRQRFTWAHELGHVVERKSVANDDEYSFEELQRGVSYDLHEFFADEFAGALLMPQFEIERLKALGLPAESMARHFGVSGAAVRKRLERLEKHPGE